MHGTKTFSRLLIALVVTLLVVGCATAGSPAPTPQLVEAPLGAEVDSVVPGIVVERLLESLDEPWGMDFLPSGELLVTEKEGMLLRLQAETFTPLEVQGVPTIASAGQGGLLDVLVHPDFNENRWIYLSYVVEEDGQFSTRVSRARLRGTSLGELEILFTAEPFFEEKRHFGSRLLLDDGYLYITVGDRGNRDLAQRLDTHNGKVIRLLEDGQVPDSNPYAHLESALPEIWTYGHRNPQGIARNPTTGDIWVAEHGPQGGDEVNRLIPGANYGWPVITYGEEYGGGKIGEGTHRENMEQPLVYWVPSIGASGMDFYNSELYPGWRPSLLVAGLRLTRLARVEIDGDVTGTETSLLTNLNLRVRDVQVGPDGLVYVLAGGGELIRLQLTE